MKFKEASLTFVVIGDWNYSYLQPNWISQNIFETTENISIELNVNQGNSYSVNFKRGGISVKPGQKAFTISCDSIDNESILLFEKACIGFMKNGISPLIKAFGLNIQFIESDITAYTEAVDSLPDNDCIIDAGAEIVQTQLVRSLRYDEKLFNLTYSQEGEYLNIGVNQHNESGKRNSEIELETGFVNHFIESTKTLLSACGYSLEEEEE